MAGEAMVIPNPLSLGHWWWHDASHSRWAGSAGDRPSRWGEGNRRAEASNDGEKGETEGVDGGTGIVRNKERWGKQWSKERRKREKRDNKRGRTEMRNRNKPGGRKQEWLEGQRQKWGAECGREAGWNERAGRGEREGAGRLPCLASVYVFTSLHCRR